VLLLIQYICSHPPHLEIIFSICIPKICPSNGDRDILVTRTSEVDVTPALIKAWSRITL